MNKFIAAIIFGLLLMAGLLISYANNDQKAAPPAELQINSTQSSVGSVYENNFDEQKLSYQASLYNAGEQSLFIAWVEPVFAEELTLKTTDLRIDVQKNIATGQTLEIKGEVRFDTKGLTKEEIIKWEPFLRGFKISNERLLEINKAN